MNPLFGLQEISLPTLFLFGPIIVFVSFARIFLDVKWHKSIIVIIGFYSMVWTAFLAHGIWPNKQMSQIFWMIWVVFAVGYGVFIVREWERKVYAFGIAIALAGASFLIGISGLVNLAL